MYKINDTAHRSPNYDRNKDGSPVIHVPLGMLLHSDEGTEASSIPWLCNPKSKVSSQYYVTRDARIYQLVPDVWRAWHGGPGAWDGVTDLNRFIGVEAEHQEGQDWPKIQRDALAWLFRTKMQQYGIPSRRVTTHRWAALPKGRKGDPTDWPDVELMTWIAALTQPDDPWALWGTTFALPVEARTHGIPKAWYPERRWLKEARSGALYECNDQLVIQVFQGGLISYDTRNNLPTLTRFPREYP